MRAAVLVLLTLSSTALADNEAPNAYEPGTVRLYAGPVLWVPFAANNFDIFALGGTLAAQWYVDARRMFFIGARLAFLGDPQGMGAGYVGGFADAEAGVRPRLVLGRKSAFAVLVSGGVGGGFVSCGACSSLYTTGYAHLSLRAGLGFDFGAFTMDALGGPTVLVNGNGNADAIEALVELGVRF